MAADPIHEDARRYLDQLRQRPAADQDDRPTCRDCCSGCGTDDQATTPEDRMPAEPTDRLRLDPADPDALNALTRAEQHTADLADRIATLSQIARDAATEIEHTETERDQARRERDEWERRARRLMAAAPAADKAHRQIRAIREARTHTCDRHCTEGGCDFDLAAFVDRVDEILDDGQDAAPPSLGSPPARAQGQAEACPTCSGPVRETVDMVCQTCGADYSTDSRAQGISIEGLLANVARSLTSARDDNERAEAIEMLLSGWYAAWPDSAVTDPDGPLAGELVRLLGRREPVGIRPADWQQQAVSTARDALIEYWGYESGDPTPEQMAADVVRGIIDAGLACAGGRCPQCRATYPRTMPSGEDQRCWTCSTAEVDGLDEYADRAQDDGTLTRCCAHPGCPRTYRADAGPQERGWIRLRGLTVLCPDHAAHAAQPVQDAADGRSGPGEGERTPEAQTRVLSWDWREQPDLFALAHHVRELSGGTLFLQQAATDGDEYAIVLSTTDLDAEAAWVVWRAKG